LELGEESKYKKAKYCRHHQLEDTNYSKHPPQNKILCTLLTATVSDRTNAIAKLLLCKCLHLYKQSQ
jgi:hypothetical protein